MSVHWGQNNSSDKMGHMWKIGEVCNCWVEEDSCFKSLKKSSWYWLLQIYCTDKTIYIKNIYIWVKAKLINNIRMRRADPHVNLSVNCNAADYLIQAMHWCHFLLSGQINSVDFSFSEVEFPDTHIKVWRQYEHILVWRRIALLELLSLHVPDNRARFNYATPSVLYSVSVSGAFSPL